MLAPASLAAADGYWARFFGVDADRLRPEAPIVVEHSAELAGYAGAYAQTFGGAAALVSLPPALLASHGALAAEAARGGLDDVGRWVAVFGTEVTATIGPATVRYADAATFRPLSAGDDVRLLGPEDADAVEALRRAFTDAEWERGGSEPEHPAAGAFADGVLAALAGYEVWGGSIAHIAIITHPAHRGRGLGAAAVSRITAEALDRGLLPQYRTLEANAPSVAIANRLGFQPYARSLAVRLAL